MLGELILEALERSCVILKALGVTLETRQVMERIEDRKFGIESGKLEMKSFGLLEEPIEAVHARLRHKKHQESWKIARWCALYAS